MWSSKPVLRKVPTSSQTASNLLKKAPALEARASESPTVRRRPLSSLAAGCRRMLAARDLQQSIVADDHEGDGDDEGEPHGYVVITDIVGAERRQGGDDEAGVAEENAQSSDSSPFGFIAGVVDPQHSPTDESESYESEDEDSRGRAHKHQIGNQGTVHWFSFWQDCRAHIM